MQASSEASGEAVASQARQRRRMSTRNRILFFVTAWLIVLMPFLFWWNTWFGRALSDKELNKYLYDDAHPRHIQHALVQIGERMARRDGTVTQWYPRVSQLASSPVEQVRNTDAWVMGQDLAGSGFHQALLNMLSDPAPVVRGNAALSLVRFGDASGRKQIVELLAPATVVAPQAGQVTDAAAPGSAIRQGAVLVKLRTRNQTIEVHSPISGRIRAVSTAAGRTMNAGAEIAIVDPATEQVWEALRALYVVGQPEDLPSVLAYERELPGISDRVRQQAAETEKAIRQRSR
jgi:hypothetical protein